MKECEHSEWHKDKNGYCDYIIKGDMIGAGEEVVYCGDLK